MYTFLVLICTGQFASPLSFSEQFGSKSCGPGPIGWICKSRFDYMVTPPARFAVEEFNKNKVQTDQNFLKLLF